MISPDPELFAAIQQIKAVDHHAHALPARKPDPAESERPDPLGKTPFPYPVRLRVTNPEYVEAWRALYGYGHDDMADDHVCEALKAKLCLMEQKGVDYPAWVLDQAGIEVMLVNMPELGSGQTGPRFLWVPYADGLLFPFEATQAMGSNLGSGKAPATLDEYINQVVPTQLQQWKADGAVAIKFGIAYRRPLDIANVPVAEAQSIYERYVRGGKPSIADDKALQDLIFRTVAREAGRLGLAVHIHTGIGADPYFNISGSNPLLLESVFNDATLRETNFVMLHGGWPFEREAGVMLIKPNVYADFSSQTFLRSTRALSRVLEEWLEWYPEKILFGTDAYPDDTPLADWEEKVWLTARTAREALALALTRMIQAGQIARSRAEELACLVLRDNAVRLYGLGQ
ncbi:MAG: amidohydrolase family protein [Anaerolineae bacterium]|nr:amidohydrolase family protein [Anaerolineae bacterium]